MSGGDARIVHGYFDAGTGKTHVWISPIYSFRGRSKDHLPDFALLMSRMLGTPVQKKE